MQLSTEELFKIRSFSIVSRNLSEEETKTRLVDLYREVIEMDSQYKELICKKWGIGT